MDLSNRLKGNSKRFSGNLLSQDLSLRHYCPVKKAVVDLSNTLNTGYYMAARGYKFYLRVLKVSLTSERSERMRDTFSTRR